MSVIPATPLAQAVKKSVHQFRIENGRAWSEGRNRHSGAPGGQGQVRQQGRHWNLSLMRLRGASRPVAD